MSHPPTAATPPPELDSASADELVALIESLLDAGEFVAAQHAAAHGAERFGDHAWLRRAHQVLNPGPTMVRPGPEPHRDRAKELEWLRRNRHEYQGKWVALLDGRLVACGESFEELMQSISGSESQARPLVHHVA